MTLDPETMLDPAVEPELRMARRGFPKSQQLLSGVALRRIPSKVPVGWHDSAGHPEQGATAVVRRDGPYTDLLGEILIVTYRLRAIYVYCVASADIVRDISLARRPFHELSRLARASIPCTIEVRA